jgi:hypothetical protein
MIKIFFIFVLIFASLELNAVCASNVDGKGNHVSNVPSALDNGVANSGKYGAVMSDLVDYNKTQSYSKFVSPKSVEIMTLQEAYLYCFNLKTTDFVTVSGELGITKLKSEILGRNTYGDGYSVFNLEDIPSVYPYIKNNLVKSSLYSSPDTNLVNDLSSSSPTTEVIWNNEQYYSGDGSKTLLINPALLKYYSTDSTTMIGSGPFVSDDSLLSEHFVRCIK